MFRSISSTKHKDIGLLFLVFWSVQRLIASDWTLCIIFAKQWVARTHCACQKRKEQRRKKSIGKWMYCVRAYQMNTITCVICRTRKFTVYANWLHAVLFDLDMNEIARNRTTNTREKSADARNVCGTITVKVGNL